MEMAKAAFWGLGSYPTQVAFNARPSSEKAKSHSLFNSSLCGTCDMDGVHFTQWHTHCELHRPYFNNTAMSGKHLRRMLKLHPEEIQQYTFATVFL